MKNEKVMKFLEKLAKSDKIAKKYGTEIPNPIEKYLPTVHMSDKDNKNVKQLQIGKKVHLFGKVSSKTVRSRKGNKDEHEAQIEIHKIQKTASKKTKNRIFND